jgi:hypothetical protein
MPLVQTRGAASAQGFGEFAQVTAIPYIEDVFSCFLYTGNSTTGGTQTITNSIDLSTKGGLVWIKGRSAASNHILTDTSRGAGTTASNNQALSSNLTTAEDLAASHDFLSAFNTTGFAVTQGGTTAATRGTNYNAVTYSSWTFREQPKFFDIVTWTGNGANRTIAHSLGSVPGSIIVKRTDTTGDWQVYHRSLANTEYLVLNTTAAKATGATRWNSTTPTSAVFSLGTDATVNASAGTYVAYLFAHDAGGFGLTGTDNVISCGTYTGDGADPGPDINLGYETQWVFIKNSSDVASWRCFDVMRGMPVGAGDALLQLNSTAVESTQDCIRPTATGFQLIGADQAGGVAYNVSGNTYIYIAIRRGPMKVPTTGTSVFDTQTYTGTQVARTITTANTVDLSFTKSRSTAGTRWNWTDRLRGATKTIDSSLQASEADDTTGYTSFAVQKGYTLGTGDTYDVNTSGRTYVSWNFTRTPSFFDEVCYTGTGSATTQTHNLGVVPEMMIVKARLPASGTFDWFVYTAGQGNGHFTRLNSPDEKTTGTQWNSTTPTASVFSIGATSDVNQSGGTYVAYLFATCAGVSKVGSYTGTGATRTIDCGFTSSARFVLIKKTNDPGDWYVWDSARGISASNDPYLLFDTTDAEVTSANYVDTDTTGFRIVTSNPAVNANSSTYIFLAIA